MNEAVPRNTQPNPLIEITSDLSLAPRILESIVESDEMLAERQTRALSHAAEVSADDVEATQTAQDRVIATRLTLLAKMTFLGENPGARPTYDSVTFTDNRLFVSPPSLESLSTPTAIGANPTSTIEGQADNVEDHTAILHLGELAEVKTVADATAARQRAARWQQGGQKGREDRGPGGEPLALGNTQYETHPAKVALEASNLLRLAERYEVRGMDPESESTDSERRADIEEANRLRHRAAQIVREGRFLTARRPDNIVLQQVVDKLREI